jgi:carboxymethylenebutenolidase
MTDQTSFEATAASTEWVTIPTPDGPMRVYLARPAAVPGRAAFAAATAIPGLGATVVFYGPGIAAGPHAVLDRVTFIDAPLLLHVGAQDPTIPAEQVKAIDSALADAGVTFDSYVYDNAGHAFACDARPHMYHAEPARLAWQRTHEFLERHLPAGA